MEKFRETNENLIVACDNRCHSITFRERENCLSLSMWFFAYCQLKFREEEESEKCSFPSLKVEPYVVRRTVSFSSPNVSNLGIVLAASAH